eukprot:15053557-Alexandrium_andersonii.AAC.1
MPRLSLGPSHAPPGSAPLRVTEALRSHCRFPRQLGHVVAARPVERSAGPSRCRGRPCPASGVSPAPLVLLAAPRRRTRAVGPPSLRSTVRTPSTVA